MYSLLRLCAQSLQSCPTLCDPTDWTFASCISRTTGRFFTTQPFYTLGMENWQQALAISTMTKWKQDQVIPNDLCVGGCSPRRRHLSWALHREMSWFLWGPGLERPLSKRPQRRNQACEPGRGRWKREEMKLRAEGRSSQGLASRLRITASPWKVPNKNFIIWTLGKLKQALALKPREKTTL